MRTKISFHRNENKYIKSLFGQGRTSLVWLKVASVDCELLLIAPFLFIFSFFKGLHVLGFFDQSYDFSRKSLSKYLMDMIDFNKHVTNILVNTLESTSFDGF